MQDCALRVRLRYDVHARLRYDVHVRLRTVKWTDQHDQARRPRPRTATTPKHGDVGCRATFLEL